jgi:hypothetical protein
LAFNSNNQDRFSFNQNIWAERRSLI